jgi:hypothetical protein
MTAIRAIRLASLVTAINVLVASGFSDVERIVCFQFRADCPFGSSR